MNGPIGKQMVDTFFESSANFEVSGEKCYCFVVNNYQDKLVTDKCK